jgi:hypothetical protein
LKNLLVNFFNSNFGGYGDPDNKVLSVDDVDIDYRNRVVEIHTMTFEDSSSNFYKDYENYQEVDMDDLSAFLMSGADEEEYDESLEESKDCDDEELEESTDDYYVIYDNGYIGQKPDLIGPLSKELAKEEAKKIRSKFSKDDRQYYKASAKVYKANSFPVQQLLKADNSKESDDFENESLKESTDNYEWERLCKQYCDIKGYEFLFANDDNFGYYDPKTDSFTHKYVDELVSELRRLRR